MDTTDLEENTKAEILEEILCAAEKLFQYERYVDENKRFPQLTKYLFKFTEGKTDSKEVSHYKSAFSSGTVNKKQFESTPAAIETDPATDSYTQCAEALADLKTVKNKLSKNFEDLKQLQAQCEREQDASWDRKAKEVEEKACTLSAFLEKVRKTASLKLAPSETYDEELKSLQAVLTEAYAHEKASRTVVKSLKQLGLVA